MFKIIGRETFDRIVRERDQGDDYAVQADARIAELEREIKALRATGHVLEDNLDQIRGENISLRAVLAIAREANAELRAQLDDRQVIAVRDEKTGRFTKRDAA